MALYPNTLADAHLVEGMAALAQTGLEPEALLYDAFATLGLSLIHI